jgi:hypothetical protein
VISSYFESFTVRISFAVYFIKMALFGSCSEKLLLEHGLMWNFWKKLCDEYQARNVEL